MMVRCQECRLFVHDDEVHHGAYCATCCPFEVLGVVCTKEHPEGWLPKFLFGIPVVVETPRGGGYFGRG